MPFVIALLYDFSLFLLLGLAIFVFFKNPHAPVNRYFTLAALAFLSWLATLYVFGQTTEPEHLTWLGRVNFASIQWVVVFGYCFLRELVGQPIPSRWIGFSETLLISVLTLFTGMIDARESIEAGVHVTTAGPLFFLFAAHVSGYPLATIFEAFRARHAASPRLRNQLAVIGLGIGITAVIALVTGVALPYGFHIFSYEEIGALSVVVVALAVAYAITVDHLFDVRIVIRKALVFAVLVGLVEKVYSGGIELLAGALPGAEQSPLFHKAISLTTVLFIAVSFEPVKKWLERQLDRWTHHWRSSPR